jgi:hypothetical protein
MNEVKEKHNPTFGQVAVFDCLGISMFPSALSRVTFSVLLISGHCRLPASVI